MGPKDFLNLVHWAEGWNMLCRDSQNMIRWTLYWTLLQSSFTFDQFAALQPHHTSLGASKRCDFLKALYNYNKVRLPALSANDLLAGLWLVRTPEWLQTVMLWCFPVEFLITVKLENSWVLELFAKALLKLNFLKIIFQNHKRTICTKSLLTVNDTIQKFSSNCDSFSQVTPGLYLTIMSRQIKWIQYFVCFAFSCQFQLYLTHFTIFKFSLHIFPQN